MNRTERIYKIELLIRTRECVSFATLLDELEVSPATLKRDLAYLRERMDAPIDYDRDANGYRFSAMAVAATGKQHELPGLWFSEKELHALLTMHQLMAGLDDGGILTRHLAPMLEKLTTMLGSDEHEAKELMKRVKIMGTARRRVVPQFFETVGSALVQRRRLQMSYKKRGASRTGGAVTERAVSPQRLVYYRHTWYLDAWCHQSDGLRRFALDAMVTAAALPDKAKTVSLASLEAELDQGYGIFAGAHAQVATLVFEAQAAQWVSNEEWHPAQTSRWLDDGRWELCVPYVEATELLMDIWRHAGRVRVLAPPELREAHAQRLHEAVATLTT